MNAPVLPGEDTDDLTTTTRRAGQYAMTGGTIDHRRKRTIEELVAAAQQGDRAAFGAIYDRYMDTIFRYLYFRCGSRQLAEDLTSETFLRALKRIGSFRWKGRDLGAWLTTIAKHLLVDNLKSGRARWEVSTDEPPEPVTDPLLRSRQRASTDVVGSVSTYLTNVTLLTAVKELPGDQQDVIVLRFLCGFSVEETAEVMGKSQGAVKAATYRAVRALYRLLPVGFEW